MGSAVGHTVMAAPRPLNDPIFLSVSYPHCLSLLAIYFIFNSKVIKCYCKAIGYEIVELLHVKLLGRTNSGNS